MSNTTITICVTVPMVLIAIGMFISSIFLFLRGERTTGIVVDYEARRGNRGGTTYAEVVEFQTVDGKMIRFVERGSRSRIFLSTGHSVNVIYNPENPYKARINSLFNLYFTPIILLIIAFMLMIFNIPSLSVFRDEVLKMIQSFMDKILK